MWLSVFSNTIYWKDCFPIVYSWFLHHKLTDHIWVPFSLRLLIFMANPDLPIKTWSNVTSYLKPSLIPSDSVNHSWLYSADLLCFRIYSRISTYISVSAISLAFFKIIHLATSVPRWVVISLSPSTYLGKNSQHSSFCVNLAYSSQVPIGKQTTDSNWDNFRRVYIWS